MTDLADAAIDYAGRGIPVFPLQPATKIPLKGSAGWKDATTDLEVVKRWWREEPRRNIGTVPGQSGLVVVDLDTVEQLEAFHRAVTAEGEPPPTRITQSPSDPASRHYWYRPTAPVEFTKCEIELDGEKILVVGAGQYVLLPPSVHPVGAEYRFVAKQPAAPIPDWLADMVANAPALSPNGKATDPEIEAWLKEASAPATNDKGRDAVTLAVGQLTLAGRGGRHETLKKALAGLLNRAGAEGVDINLEDALDQLRDTYAARFTRSEKRRPWKELDALVGWVVSERVKAGEEANDHAPRVEGVRSKKKTRPRRAVALHPASTVKPEPVSWLWQGRLALGTLGLIAGPPGLGKTLVAIFLSAQVSTGKLEGDLEGEPSSVLYASAEDSMATTLVPRLIAAGADLNRVSFIAISEGNGLEESLTFPVDTDLLASAVHTADAKMVVLDPVVAHIATELDSHRDHQVRRVLGPLAHLADDTGALVLGIAHLNKGVGGDFLARVSGSVGFGAAVRAALGVATDPSDPAGEQRVLAHIKSNIGPKTPPRAFRVVEAVIGDREKIVTARVEWGEELPDLALSDLLGSAADKDERGDLTEAGIILKLVLADGPRRADDARKLVRDAAGCSDRTVDRAKQRLGVETTRKGGFAGDGWWEWELPKDAKDATDFAGVEGDDDPETVNHGSKNDGVDNVLRGEDE